MRSANNGRLRRTSRTSVAGTLRQIPPDEGNVRNDAGVLLGALYALTRAEEFGHDAKAANRRRRDRKIRQSELHAVAAAIGDSRRGVESRLATSTEARDWLSGF